MNVGGGIHCPCIHLVDGCHCHFLVTCCGGSIDSKMVGVGIVVDLSGVTNNFLFLFVFVVDEPATPFVVSCPDSTSFSRFVT
jgi:hypothetical protein